MSKAADLPAGHPRNHGYEKCSRCKSWRRVEGLESVPDAAMTAATGVPTSMLVCMDAAWCSSQAGVGKGILDNAVPSGP